MDLTRIVTTSRLVDEHREITLVGIEANLTAEQRIHVGEAAILRARHSVASTLARVGMEAAAELRDRKLFEDSRPRRYCNDCVVGGIGLLSLHLECPPELYVSIPPSEVVDWRTRLTGWLDEVAQADKEVDAWAR